MLAVCLWRHHPDYMIGVLYPLRAVWKSIWNCKTLPKLQQFLWRACVSGLATGDALTRRNVHADPLCVRCGERETASHIILVCTYARAVWFGSPLGSISLLPDDQRFSDWIASWKLFSRLGKKESSQSRPLITLCSFICWHIWLSRNDLVFGHKVWQPTEVIAAAVKAFREYDANTSNVDSCSPTLVDRPLQWVAPTVDYVKCNCDASYAVDSAKSGIGFFCRDHNGQPMLAASNPSPFSDILVGEAIAVRFAMMEMIKVGFVWVMIESDNASLISYIKGGGGTSPLHIRAVVDDIVNVSSSFVSSCFFSIRREINSVADSLARRALALTCTTEWPISTPWLRELCFSLPP
ncbi:uncharacterized protein LOC122665697 [Telopea speciosissima]|uniref:uncharacterized protein LOC122665697 n=1 Tax=Telopea speciosissima TaxID=54955 RepID=UPI001CC40474|nr:uncharacterized protein LOC122665697 [Telopea speciosissima]